MEANFFQVSDYFDVKFENMFDLNFISYSKVKGARVAFNLVLAKRSYLANLLGQGEIDNFLVYGGGILLLAWLF